LNCLVAARPTNRQWDLSPS